MRHINPWNFYDAACNPTKLRVETLNDRQWISVAAFLHRPYFKRVWVIQEISQTRKISLVCGNTSMQLVRTHEDAREELGRWRLENFWQRIAPCLATDPRGKIYSLIGMCQTWTSRHSPMRESLRTWLPTTSSRSKYSTLERSDFLLSLGAIFNR